MLVNDWDEYRVDISCDIPDSDYAEVIRRKSTMRNFCIRVIALIPLPRRNKKGDDRLQTKDVFTSMVLVDNK